MNLWDALTKVARMKKNLGDGWTLYYVELFPHNGGGTWTSARVGIGYELDIPGEGKAWANQKRLTIKPEEVAPWLDAEPVKASTGPAAGE